MRYILELGTSEWLGAQIYNRLIPYLFEETPFVAELRAAPVSARRGLAHNLAHVWLHRGHLCGELTEFEEWEADWGAYAILWPHAASSFGADGRPNSVVS